MAGIWRICADKIEKEIANRLRYDPKRASLQAEWSIPKLLTDKKSKIKRESTGTIDVILAVQNVIEQ